MDSCPFILLLTSVIIGILCTSLADGGALGRDKVSEKNGNQMLSHVKKRDLREKIDADIMNRLANIKLDKHLETRKRRQNEGVDEIEKHLLKAEADTIAAAEEDSAAQSHAVAAAVETAEAEQKIEEETGLFEENENGEMIRIAEDQAISGHRGRNNFDHGHNNGLRFEDSHSNNNEIVHEADVENFLKDYRRGENPHGHHMDATGLDDVIKDLGNKVDSSHGTGHHLRLDEEEHRFGSHFGGNNQAEMEPIHLPDFSHGNHPKTFLGESEEHESGSRLEEHAWDSEGHAKNVHGGGIGHGQLGGTGEITHLPSSKESEDREHQLENEFAHTADVETPIMTLLEQSTDLGKETKMMFQVIAKREGILIAEMGKFKEDLQKAIAVLRETEKESKARYKRWDNGNFEPYKACVYVSPPDGSQGFQSRYGSYSPPELLSAETTEPPPPPPPPAPEMLPKSNTAALTQSQSYGEDIDLSSIYWLKLPQSEQESALEKVQKVLAEVRQSGRDVLLVPVLKGFTSANDMANGFLRAVRVNPADAQSSKRKRKLRLRIRRVL